MEFIWISTYRRKKQFGIPSILECIQNLITIIFYVFAHCLAAKMFTLKNDEKNRLIIFKTNNCSIIRNSFCISDFYRAVINKEKLKKKSHGLADRRLPAWLRV